MYFIFLYDKRKSTDTKIAALIGATKTVQVAVPMLANHWLQKLPFRDN